MIAQMLIDLIFTEGCTLVLGMTGLATFLQPRYGQVLARSKDTGSASGRRRLPVCGRLLPVSRRRDKTGQTGLDPGPEGCQIFA